MELNTNIKRILINAGLVVAGVLTLLSVIGVLGAPLEAVMKVGILAILAVPLLVLALRRDDAGRLLAIVLALVITPLIFVVVNWADIFAFADNALRWVFEPATRTMNIVACSDDAGCNTVWPIVFSLLFFFVVLTGFAYTTLLERRLIAFLQQRIGPNRVGPLGFLQPLADAVKLIFKEDFMPSGASPWIYRLAPMIKTLPILLLFGVVPIGPDIIIPWFAPSLGDVWYRVPLGIADPSVGLLYLFAVTSLGTYGVVLAGWASNNKYAMLGALRASAQMISYELSFGLALAVPIMLAGSMRIGDIIGDQVMIWEWYVFQNPVAAIILIIAVLAETNRAPFDLPEAEQELTQGYQTEYSGMKFAMFMMAEYLGMIAVSALTAITFFGGYNDGFGLVQTAPILAPLVMIGKIVLMLSFMVWVRATLPRIRYDRLMQFGWKIMLPVALLAVIWTAVSVVLTDMSGSPTSYGIASAIFFVVVVGAAYFMFGRSTDESAEDEALDPLITGERGGLGYAAMNLVGGLIAVPFALYDGTIKALDKLGTIDPTPAETAIEPVESETRPANPAGND